MRKEKLMAIKQQIKNTINFEADQQDAMKKTSNIHSLADQVEKLEELNERLEDLEGLIKNTKQDIQKVSGDIIPTMMSEMGLAELKLHKNLYLYNPIYICCHH